MPWRPFGAALLSASLVDAQAPPTFEVASVRRNMSSDSETTWRVPAAGTFIISNATARLLVNIAYEIPLSMERSLLVDASNSALLRGRSFSPTSARIDECSAAVVNELRRIDPTAVSEAKDASG